MPTVDIVVQSKINKSFRVKQLESIFDLPVKDIIEHKWTFDADVNAEKWNIGLFVGASGSGKTQILKKLFPENIHTNWQWDNNSVVDNISDNYKIQDIIKVFSSVGFSSPPSWLKPFSVLSNGEKFRCELARCILDYDKLFVFDEFSSVVDRDVAKVTSYAVSKSIKTFNRQMIAASCHYDIIEWLEPDWVYDLRDNTFTRRLLRRPKIELSIYEIQRTAWQMFKQHHYLSGNLHKASKCFGAYMNNKLVGFCAVLSKVGFKGCSRVHRLVILPDYQGVGIGITLLNFVGNYYKNVLNRKMYITSSHPSVVKGLAKTNEWNLSNYYSRGTYCGSPRSLSWTQKTMRGRPATSLASYVYVGN